MNYSQRKLVELAKSGHLLEEKGLPKHIETVISNVFLFEKTVYKIYKNDNDFFNANFRDISGKTNRFEFTKRDFDWNQALSPTIYLDLKGIKIDNDSIIACGFEEAEELAIVMDRVDSKDFLCEKLLSKEIAEGSSFTIGKQFGESMKKVQEPIRNADYYQELFNRTKDLENWLVFAEKYVSREEASRYCQFLYDSLEKNRDLFKGQLSKEIVRDGDIHSFNSIFSNGKFHLMDTFPPKEEWSVGHPMLSLYRLGTDIWVFGEKKSLFEEFLKGYQEVCGPISRNLESFYIVYAASIMLSYLYQLSQSDPKEKRGALLYHKFIREYYDKHCLKNSY